jgi:hypothetical protein
MNPNVMEVSGMYVLDVIVLNDLDELFDVPAFSVMSHYM